MYNISVMFSDIDTETPEEAAQAFAHLMQEYLSGTLGGLYVSVTDTETNEKSLILIDPTGDQPLSVQE